MADELGAPDGNNHDEARVVKSKQFALKPMSVDEATLQLELIGHDFFVFTNAETNDTNVVYRRNDGALRSDRARPAVVGRIRLRVGGRRGGSLQAGAARTWAARRPPRTRHAIG